MARARALWEGRKRNKRHVAGGSRRSAGGPFSAGALIEGVICRTTRHMPRAGRIPGAAQLRVCSHAPCGPRSRRAGQIASLMKRPRQLRSPAQPRKSFHRRVLSPIDERRLTASNPRLHLPELFLLVESSVFFAYLRLLPRGQAVRQVRLVRRRRRRLRHRLQLGLSLPVQRGKLKDFGLAAQTPGLGAAWRGAASEAWQRAPNAAQRGAARGVAEAGC